MTSTLNYEGYVAILEIDVDAGLIHGEVVNTRDVLTFSVSDISKARDEFEATIKDYVAWCADEGVEPEKPYSGVLTLRLAPATHRKAASRAAAERISLAAWLQRTIECALGERPAHVSEADLSERMAVGVREELLKVLQVRTVVGADALNHEPDWERPPSRGAATLQ